MQEEMRQWTLRASQAGKKVDRLARALLRPCGLCVTNLQAAGPAACYLLLVPHALPHGEENGRGNKAKDQERKEYSCWICGRPMTSPGHTQFYEQRYCPGAPGQVEWLWMRRQETERSIKALTLTELFEYHATKEKKSNWKAPIYHKKLHTK